MKWLDRLLGKREDGSAEAEQRQRHRHAMERVDDLVPDEKERHRKQLQLEYDVHRGKRR